MAGRQGAAASTLSSTPGHKLKEVVHSLRPLQSSYLGLFKRLCNLYFAFSRRMGNLRIIIPLHHSTVAAAASPHAS